LSAHGRKRLGAVSNVGFCQGDMRAPPFADRRFDQVFLMHALSYAHDPKTVIAKAAALLRQRAPAIRSPAE